MRSRKTHNNEGESLAGGGGGGFLNGPFYGYPPAAAAFILLYYIIHDPRARKIQKGFAWYNQSFIGIKYNFRLFTLFPPLQYLKEFISSPPRPTPASPLSKERGENNAPPHPPAHPPPSKRGGWKDREGGGIGVRRGGRI
jgi:hypothetical protein